MSINNIFSNYELKNYLEIDKNLGFSSVYESIINDYNCNQNLKDLLSLFFKVSDYKEKLKLKIDEQKNDKIFENDPFESLLYGFRFCVQSLNFKKNDKLLYSSIFSKNCQNVIKQSFIPGNVKLNKGINLESKDIFLLSHKKVRNLSEIGFRLLNFIFYNHLFFANCLNFYSNEELNKICAESGMNCLEIIQNNWNLLDEALRKKNIVYIQIFMNLIFKRLSDLIKKCKLITKENELEEFEKEVEKLINLCINEYSNYYKNYLEINEKQVPIDKNNIKVIISELYSPTEDIYPHEQFPFLKYFTFTKYREENDLLKELGPIEDYMNEYPLLYKYITGVNEDSDVKKLKVLNDFNEFSNFMINNYSFNISRDYAEKNSLNKEQIFNNNPGLNQKLDNFMNAWAIIKDKAVKYKFNPEMKVKSLSKDDKLAYFLNDNNEQDYGMYIAAAYQNFIKFQNEFLEYIINNGNNNKKLDFYIDNLRKKICIQNVSPNQIILIDNEGCFKGTYFSNFKDLINTYSNRNIFNENGTINYLNYNSFIYNISPIEEELGKLILSGKCLFENEDKLNFVTYWGEGFSGGNLEIMNKFYSKYKQNNLNDEEKGIIIKYIKNFNENYDFKPFFGSIQLIIFYLSNNDLSNQEKISTLIETAPKYVNINADCKRFFEEDAKEFKVDKLMNVFFFFEHLCFEGLCNNLQEEYKAKIDKETEDIIKEKLLNNDQLNDSFTIKELGAALRRFISRYLIGKKIKINNINEKGSLLNKLDKPDLWDEKIGTLPNLRELISNILKDLNLSVEQSYEFYLLIKKEDEKEINLLIEEKDEPNEPFKKPNPVTNTKRKKIII